MQHIIEGKLEQDLILRAQLARPDEAVGLILENGNIIMLENLSITPENTFEVDKRQILQVLDGVEIDGRPLDVFAVTFWHSHPGGGIGPSRFDMEHKTPFRHHLIVALQPDDSAVMAWY